MAATARHPLLHRLAGEVGELEALDAPAGKLLDIAQRALKPGPLRDAASGTFLGHALHPLLTDLPIGAWTSATFLDHFGGRRSEPAARRLIGLGVAAQRNQPTRPWLAALVASDLSDIGATMADRDNLPER